MRRLEAELGVMLFERHTRGVDLTQAGEVLLGRARVALTAAVTDAATGRELEAVAIGGVRMGVAVGADWRLTPSLDRRISRERPGVDLTVVEAHGGTQWHEPREARLDALVAPSGHASADLVTL